MTLSFGEPCGFNFPAPENGSFPTETIIFHRPAPLSVFCRKDGGLPSGEQLHRHGAGGHREEGRSERPPRGVLALLSEHGRAALPEVQHLRAEERAGGSLWAEGPRSVPHSGEETLK